MGLSAICAFLFIGHSTDFLPGIVNLIRYSGYTIFCLVLVVVLGTVGLCIHYLAWYSKMDCTSTFTLMTPSVLPWLHPVCVLLQFFGLQRILRELLLIFLYVKPHKYAVSCVLRYSGVHSFSDSCSVAAVLDNRRHFWFLNHLFCCCCCRCWWSGFFFFFDYFSLWSFSSSLEESEQNRKYNHFFIYLFHSGQEWHQFPCLCCCRLFFVGLLLFELLPSFLISSSFLLDNTWTRRLIDDISACWACHPGFILFCWFCFSSSPVFAKKRATVNSYKKLATVALSFFVDFASYRLLFLPKKKQRWILIKNPLCICSRCWFFNYVFLS